VPNAKKPTRRTEHGKGHRSAREADERSWQSWPLTQERRTAYEGGLAAHEQLRDVALRYQRKASAIQDHTVRGRARLAPPIVAIARTLDALITALDRGEIDELKKPVHAKDGITVRAWSLVERDQAVERLESVAAKLLTNHGKRAADETSVGAGAPIAHGLAVTATRLGFRLARNAEASLARQIEELIRDAIDPGEPLGPNGADQLVRLALCVLGIVRDKAEAVAFLKGRKMRRARAARPESTGNT
jgi:hypothetical protein